MEFLLLLLSSPSFISPRRSLRRIHRCHAAGTLLSPKSPQFQELEVTHCSLSLTGDSTGSQQSRPFLPHPGLQKSSPGRAEGLEADTSQPFRNLLSCLHQNWFSLLTCWSRGSLNPFKEGKGQELMEYLKFQAVPRVLWSQGSGHTFSLDQSRILMIWNALSTFPDG